MIRPLALSAMVVALSLTSATFAATTPDAPASVPAIKTAAKAAKVKEIAFNVSNNSKVTMSLQAGASQLTLQPGEKRHLRLPAGTAITTLNATQHFAANTLLITVNSSLAGNTVAIS